VQHTHDALRTAGLRLGRPREAVIELIGRHGCLLSAQEIAERLTAEGNRVSLPTVYRTLDTLHGLGLLVALLIARVPANLLPAHGHGQRAISRGSAWRSAMTAEACVAAVSASTPSAPITIPAITTPCSDNPGELVMSVASMSLTLPSSRVIFVAKTAGRRASSSVAEIPSAAASVCAPMPLGIPAASASKTATRWQFWKAESVKIVLSEAARGVRAIREPGRVQSREHAPFVTLTCSEW
jgi:hypothetical protein